MSVEVKGLDKLLKDLEDSFSQRGMKPVIEKALDVGAKQFNEVLIPELEKFKDTGATVNEVTYSKVYYDNGIPKKTVHWQGPKDRYRLIHLNEHGYDRRGKKIKPRGYGAIARALSKGKPVYYAAIEKTVKGAL